MGKPDKEGCISQRRTTSKPINVAYLLRKWWSGKALYHPTIGTCRIVHLTEYPLSGTRKIGAISVISLREPWRVVHFDAYGCELGLSEPTLYPSKECNNWGIWKLEQELKEALGVSSLQDATDILKKDIPTVVKEVAAEAATAEAAEEAAEADTEEAVEADTEEAAEEAAAEAVEEEVEAVEAPSAETAEEPAEEPAPKTIISRIAAEADTMLKEVLACAPKAVREPENAIRTIPQYMASEHYDNHQRALIYALDTYAEKAPAKFKAFARYMAAQLKAAWLIELSYGGVVPITISSTAVCWHISVHPNRVKGRQYRLRERQQKNADRIDTGLSYEGLRKFISYKENLQHYIDAYSDVK